VIVRPQCGEGANDDAVVERLWLRRNAVDGHLVAEHASARTLPVRMVQRAPILVFPSN